MSGLPYTRRGRRSVKQEQRYQAELEQFCDRILEIRSRLDFEVSSRGWCYILENDGVITKSEFDKAQTVINDCRKSGMLPLDICAEDGTRIFDHLEFLDSDSAESEAENWVWSIQNAYKRYQPISFWDGQEYYVQMYVEKIDLKSLFSKTCEEYRIPLANSRGWSDINSRAAMMRRFAEHEAEGRQCVLLYCGDHDPGGLCISDFIMSNLEDIAGAVGWHPRHLTIDRFGLNYDFIMENQLSWVDNLETSSKDKKRLDDPKHPDHFKPYVQNYLKRFGARKVEANALVTRPAAGRELCRQAILKYLSDDAPQNYEERLQPHREQLRVELLNQIQHIQI